MTRVVVKYACPYCEEQFRELNTLKSHLEETHSPKAAPPVWGREVYPPPRGTAFIDSDVMKCVGCGLCAEACSMKHFGVMNKDFARIHVRKFILTLAACNDNSLWQRQEEFSDMYSGKFLVDDSKMPHGTGLRAESATHTFHDIGINKGRSFWGRIDFPSPHHRSYFGRVGRFKVGA